MVDVVKEAELREYLAHSRDRLRHGSQVGLGRPVVFSGPSSTIRRFVVELVAPDAVGVGEAGNPELHADGAIAALDVRVDPLDDFVDRLPVRVAVDENA